MQISWRIILGGFFALFSIQHSFCQVFEDTSRSEDDFQYEAFLHTMENALAEFHRERAEDPHFDSIVASYGYDESAIPSFEDEVYCERLNVLNLKSPFHLDCNSHVLKTIRYFEKKRRYFTSVTIGRSALYFNYFEEVLAKHDMPLELKYLAVIESGLRPQAKSKAGALGLWQFMYRTGKIYGLEETSYVDHRMDPVLSTEAACLYLKKLYSMYGDWNMALAAYNAGPGNVNKAIRRSGGKMTYWEIRPYLPLETQGYIPNFIAMSYLMNHYVDHNIKPLPPKYYDFEVDTVCLKSALYMETIDSLIGWAVEDVQFLNPIYKTTYIPKTEPGQCLTIPTEFLSSWIHFEDSIYRLDSSLHMVNYNTIYTTNTSSNSSVLKNTANIMHTVRSGENLSSIASKYGTTVNSIMRKNDLQSTRLKVGQKLVIQGNSRSVDIIKSEEAQQTSKSSPNANSLASSSEQYNGASAHIIRKGDSLWSIAKMYNTSVDNLKRLNPGIDHTDLKVGYKIRLK
jgi:membrane-bound lytic murein transglycosylase D